MIIENSLNPNCSETVYRFDKADIEKLPGGEHFIMDMISEHWGSFEPTHGYSELRPATEDQICIYFYQTECDELETTLINRGIDYKAEKPFTSSINTKEEHLYEPKN